MKHTCPVCGFKRLAEPPYDHEGNHSHDARAAVFSSDLMITRCSTRMIHI